MSSTYTYRCGEKVELDKSADEIVIRSLPEHLDDSAIVAAEQVSSASTRLRSSTDDLESLMTRSRALAPTHHAYYEATSGTEFLITDRVFITFAQELSDADVDAFAGQYGLIKKTTYSPTEYLFQLTNHTGMNPVKLVVELTENEPRVLAAEHDLNQRMVKAQFSEPSDPAYARQWHLHTQFNSQDYDVRASSRCEQAWRELDGFGDPSVVVAVADDGCKLDHEDFNSNGKFAGWGYFQGERLVIAEDIDADPDAMYQNGSNHGTSCCGVAAGDVDAQLTVGAAPRCRLLPIKWESAGPSLFISDSKLITAMNYIADRCDIMSNSWGGVPTSMWAPPVLSRIRALAETGGRRRRGIVFLWAAGNDNCPIDFAADQDVPFDSGVEVRGSSLVWVGVRTARRFRNNLVGLPGLLHVAALASNARRSHYSNYGNGIEICAPSSNSHTYHRMTVRGLGITTSTGPVDGTTNSFGGTSSATPLVAGIAALVISANSELSALEVIALLKETAAKDLDMTGYQRTPPANFDADTSWDVSPIAPFADPAFVDRGDAEGSWSPWFGHGRVDALAAVRGASSRLPIPLTDQRFRGSSAPDRSIPDNRIQGIKDTIVSAQTFDVGALTVTVEITHTYVGDLMVTLVSPTGTSVVLHSRAGGSSNDIARTYDLTTTPELRAFAGEPVHGDWLLRVQDLAARDRGRLMAWSLRIDGVEQTQVDVDESPGITIPDNVSGGITRSLSVNADGALQDIDIDLDITHTYVGDLRVELSAPDGAVVVLHNRFGGASDNIIRRYSLVNTPVLQSLIGAAIGGDWKLHVSDHAGADQGKLNRWALSLKGSQ